MTWSRLFLACDWFCRRTYDDLTEGLSEGLAEGAYAGSPQAISLLFESFPWSTGIPR